MEQILNHPKGQALRLTVTEIIFHYIYIAYYGGLIIREKRLPGATDLRHYIASTNTASFHVIGP